VANWNKLPKYLTTAEIFIMDLRQIRGTNSLCLSFCRIRLPRQVCVLQHLQNEYAGLQYAQ